MQSNNGRPGTSGSSASFLPNNTPGVNIRANATTQNTVSGGTIQDEVTGSNRRQRYFLNPPRTSANTARPRFSSNQPREPMFMQPMSVEESRGFSLIFSQGDAANSQSSLSDEDDSDDEIMCSPERLSECRETFGCYSRNSVAILLLIG